MTEGAEAVIVPDVRLIAVDETGHWEIVGDGIDASKVLRIECVYLYDRNERTHLCELTPSYCLYPVEHRPVFKMGAGLSQREIDAWDSMMMENMNYDPTYMHCSDVDRIQELAAYGGPSDPSEPFTSESVIEEASEYYRSNGCP